MGNSQSSSGTQFASAGFPVLQSVKPCHLSGDPDLYGIGIRVGFYLQYLAAIIAVVTGIDQEFVGWRAAFVPLAVATFIGLCINSTSGTLVIVDWAIMLELVLGFPFFFALPVFKGFKQDYKSREQVRLQRAYIKQLGPGREAGFNQYRDKFAVASGALMYAEEVIMDGTGSQHRDVRQLVDLVADAAERYETVTTSRRIEGGHPAAIHTGGELIQLRPAIREIRANVPGDIQALRDIVAQWRLGDREMAALEQIFPTTQEAKDAFDALKKVAIEEKVTWDLMKKEGFVLKRINDLGLVDTVSAGISLIIYSAYCFLAPWLFFFGIYRGAKADCDIKVLFFLAPVSVYNDGFVIFLKAFAVCAVIFGLVVFACGLIFLTIGLSKPLRAIVAKRNEEEASADSNPQSRHGQLGTEGTEETGSRALQRRIHGPHEHHYVVTRHMHGVRDWYHRYVTDSEDPSKEAMDRQINFNRHWWGLGLSAVFIETVIVVEMTIKINQVTSGSLLSSTGQLIALLVGVFMLLLILYKCFVKL